jgi:hypothetical protein
MAAGYFFQDTIFSTSTALTEAGLGTTVEVGVNDLCSTRAYTLIVTVATINTNVVVRLEGSIDGTNYAPIIADQTITANGTTVYSVGDRPVKYVRPRFVSESGGTAAVVTFSVAAA